MDPAQSSAKFYDALKKIRGWESLPVTVAAQRVQRSAYPSAYADDEQLAREILASLGNTGSGAADTTVTPAKGGSDPYGLGKVVPHLRDLVDVLAPRFGVATVGGYRASATDPNGHPAGLAADLMVPMTRCTLTPAGSSWKVDSVEPFRNPGDQEQGRTATDT